MKKRLKISDLSTRVTFYEYAPSSGPEPGEEERMVLYKCWAKIDNVWLKDVELAKTNGTLEDLTITIRDPRRTYIPTNKHYVEINALEYKGKRYNVKHVQLDLQRKQFITIIAKVMS